MKTSNLLLLGGFAALCLFLISHITMAKGGVTSGLELAGMRSTKTFDLPALKHLDFEGPVRLILTAGMPSVTIEADDALMSEIVDRDSEDDRLTIRVPRTGGDYRASDMIVARISSPDLRTVAMGGRNAISSTAPLTYRSLALDLSGGTELDLAFVDIDSLRVDGSGSVSGTLRGLASLFTLDGSGSADVDASGLRAKSAKIDISGSGNVRLHADSLLSVRGSGSTEVEYTGQPRVSTSVSGSGKVSAVDPLL